MSIPLLKNTAMAIILSDNVKKERIIIGEYLDIRKYFEMNINSEFIVDITRPIGEFIKDFVPKVAFMREMQIEVNNEIFDRKLQEFFDSGNPVYQYIALRTLQEFHTPDYDPFYEFSQDLMYNLFSGILETQKYYEKNPFIEMIRCVGSKNAELIFEQRNMKEVAVVTYDLLPLAMWYMRKIYDKGYYLQECRLCQKTFLAKTATIEVLCGKRCKKENARILKKEFEERIKDVDYEQTYKNEYMYWYNRLKKYDKNSSEYLAFKEFRKKAVAMKKQVKLGEIPAWDFTGWLFDQRDVVDEMLGISREYISPKEKRRRNRGGKVLAEYNEQYKNHKLYEKWLEYADYVANKYYNDMFDFEDFEYLVRMKTFIEDPKLAEKVIVKD